jgi:hypothetical protein
MRNDVVKIVTHSEKSHQFGSNGGDGVVDGVVHLRDRTRNQGGNSGSDKGNETIQEGYDLADLVVNGKICVVDNGGYKRIRN